MVLSRGKLGLAGLWWLAVLLLAVSPSQGGGIDTENFANNQYNTELWQIGTMGQGPLTYVANDSLVISIPPTATGSFIGMMSSAFGLAGDFDVQCDYDLSDWPSGNGLRAGIIFADGAASITRCSPGASEGGPKEVLSFISLGHFIEIPATDRGGKLRLKRTGNTIEGFYWANNDWHSIGYNTDVSLARAGHVMINVNSGNPGFFSGQAAKVLFDNIQVTYSALMWTIYEGFEDNSYYQDIWFTNTQGQGPSTAVANNRLEITIPSNSSSGGSPYPFGGSIGTKLVFRGDFDVQADFTLFNWPAPTGIQVGIIPTFRSGGFAAGVWLMSDPAYSPPQVYEAYLNGTDVKIGNSDTSGKLRLSRTGTTIQAYYWSTGGWQLITSRTDPSFGADCSFGMYALSHNFQGKTAQVAFDNLQIGYTGIVSETNFNPAILQLLLF
jgi:hypothetical protein